MIGIMFFTIKYFDSLVYHYDKLTMSTKELIEKHAEIKLPNDVIINNPVFEKGNGINFLTESLFAEIIIKETDVKKIFDLSFETRDYDTIPPYFPEYFNFTKEEYCFYFNDFKSVYSNTFRNTWSYQNIYYISMKPVDGKTTIYFCITSLGSSK